MMPIQRRVVFCFHFESFVLSSTRYVNTPTCCSLSVMDAWRRALFRSTPKVKPDGVFQTDGQRSKLAQGGGVLITEQMGMGPGTTLVTEPTHVALQSSRWLADTMRQLGGEFYRGATLLPVWERFRMKTTKAWKKARMAIVVIPTIVKNVGVAEEIAKAWSPMRVVVQCKKSVFVRWFVKPSKRQLQLKLARTNKSCPWMVTGESTS